MEREERGREGAGLNDLHLLDGSHIEATLAAESVLIGADRAMYGYPSGPAAHEPVGMKVLSRAHSITATLEIPPEGANGVIVSHGNDAGGYSLFIQDEHLHYVHNYCGALELHVASSEPVPVGRLRVRVDFEPTSKVDGFKGRGKPGRTLLYFDDRKVADKEFPVTVPLAVGNSGGLSIGKNAGSSVSRMYDAPFRFTGKIVSVRYDLSDRMLREAENARKALTPNRRPEL